MKDKKLHSENVDFSGQYYLSKSCIDKRCILIGLNSVICAKCSMPIHKKCSIFLKFVINDNYYCCHDCYIGAKMIVDGFPYKFVTLHDNEDYYCFLRKDDTIKELINEFLIVILGSKFSSSEDYDVKIIFSGKNQVPDLSIKNIFQIKNDNNVLFTMSKRKLSGTMSKRKLSDIQCKSISLNNQLLSLMKLLKYLSINIL